MNSNNKDNDVFDLRSVVDAVRRDRVLFFSVLLTSIAIGFGYAFLSKQWFRAEVIMVQVYSKSLPGGLSQLSGLASIAGVNLSRGDNQQPLAVLKSKSLVGSYIDSNNLVPIIFAENWDAKTGSWLVDEERVPDILDAVSRFDEDVRQISDDKKTGLITLRVVWHDPETAARWANELVQAANARLRAPALADAERNVSYLQREIASTGVVTLQESLGKVLESEMQKLLLARGNEEFAFKIIDKATPPKKRYRPYRALVLLFSAFVGLLFASLAVYVKRQLK
jgi:uncharacterized protein involved in exopolysaccharide biosynthesis